MVVMNKLYTCFFCSEAFKSYEHSVASLKCQYSTYKPDSEIKELATLKYFYLKQLTAVKDTSSINL